MTTALAVIDVLTKPTFTPAKRSTDSSLAEYAEVAASLGVVVPQIAAETFMGAMEKLNLPVYSRDQVVSYMDGIAARDGTGYGWHWLPARKKDRIKGLIFGKPSELRFLNDKGEEERPDMFMRIVMRGFDDKNTKRIPASDYYNGDQKDGIYDKTIPLRTLKRMAAVEKAYQGPVSFLVTDYATKPHIQPDPFLMAVLPGVPADRGRFVIDFWDEPGFGIDKMLA